MVHHRFAEAVAAAVAQAAGLVVAKWPAGRLTAAQKPVLAVLGMAILSAVWQLAHSPRVAVRHRCPWCSRRWSSGWTVIAPTVAAMVWIVRHAGEAGGAGVVATGAGCGAHVGVQVGDVAGDLEAGARGVGRRRLKSTVTVGIVAVWQVLHSAAVSAMWLTLVRLTGFTVAPPKLKVWPLWQLLQVRDARGS